MEFAVQMTCHGCVTAVQNALTGIQGIHSVEINLAQEQVIIQSDLPSSTLQDLIETTGKRAVLMGYGSTLGTHHLGAAVAMVAGGKNLIEGVIRFVQTNESTCVIEGTVDGLEPGHHALCVHELGDLTQACYSCGNVYTTGHTEDGMETGAVGDIEAGDNGRAVFRVENGNLKVWDLIGRSMVVHEESGDGGRWEDQPDKRLACGIIARSAGLFQNSKKICACDGVTLWDERDKPLAGEGRQSKLS